MKKFYLCRNLFLLSFTLKISPPKLYKPHHCFSSRPKNSKYVPISDYLINRHGFSPETALKASTVITSIRNPENSDSVLAFLRESGFSNAHVEKLIEVFPKILASNVEKTLKPKIKIFLDLDFSPNEVADTIVASPWTLQRSADKQLSPSIILLKEVVGTNSGISKVLKGSGWFLHHDLEKTMIPNIEYMKSCGINGTQITKFLLTFPRFFIRKPEAIKDLVERVDELGFDRKSRMYLHAIRAMGSMSRESWEVKLQLFRSLGWSEDAILFAFRRVPSVFTVSNRKIRDGTEFLVGTGKYSSSYLVLHPEVFVYSLESRIKPRLQVLEVLKSKSLISKDPSLTTICKMVDNQFIKKFVLPYMVEIGNLYTYPTPKHSQIR